MLFGHGWMPPTYAQSGLSGVFFWEERAFAMNYPLTWGFPIQRDDNQWIITPNLTAADNPNPEETTLTIAYFPRQSIEFPTTGNTYIDLRNGFSEYARAYTQVEGIALSLTLIETDYGYLGVTAYRDALHTRLALILTAEDAFVLHLRDPKGETSSDTFNSVLSTILLGDAALNPPDIIGEQTPIEISPNTPIQGTITEDQEQQVYILQAAPNQYLTVRMVADNSALDPLLAVYADRRQIGYNDDALGTFNALIPNVLLPPARFYTIVATRYSGTGDYILTATLSDRADPFVGLSNTSLAGDIVPNTPITNALTGEEGQAWRYGGQRGDVITIEMNAESESLDPYLLLLDSSGNVLASNDDIVFGENYNARIDSIRLPNDGDYYIVAMQFGFGGGTYTLLLSVR